MKLLVKGNEKLSLAAAVAVLSILALSISFSPTFNLLVKAQGENQTSSAMAQEVQQKLTALAEKVRELGTGAGVNLSLPQGGNLTDQLRTLMESPSFSNLTEQLPQELSKLGLNGTNIKDLQEESGASLAGLVQKLQNLTSSRGT